jgi:hypothetical protein
LFDAYYVALGILGLDEPERTDEEGHAVQIER